MVKVHFMLYIITLYYIYNHPSHCLAIFSPWFKTSISVVVLLYNPFFQVLHCYLPKCLDLLKRIFVDVSNGNKKHYDWGVGEGNMCFIFGEILVQIQEYGYLQMVVVIVSENSTSPGTLINLDQFRVVSRARNPENNPWKITKTARLTFWMRSTFETTMKSTSQMVMGQNPGTFGPLSWLFNGWLFPPNMASR